MMGDERMLLVMENSGGGDGKNQGKSSGKGEWGQGSGNYM